MLDSTRQSSATKKAKSADIKLVAIDLDGTLLTDAKQVSQASVRAIRSATENGVKVVIASARPPRSVRGFYQSLSLDTLQVNYNGAMIWDEPGRRVVDHRPLSAELSRAMIDLARSLHLHVQVSCEIQDRWCTDRFDPAHVTETAKFFEPDLIAPLSEFCHQPISKLMLLSDPEELSLVKIAIEKQFGSQVAIVQTESDLLQITLAGVDKAVALKNVATRYGVATSQILAIGDAANDLAMIEMAGVGVAVGNANAAVKELADWIAPTNNEDGVAAALKEFGLCG